MLALLEEGVPVKDISDLTDLFFSTIYQICQVIYMCGYHPVTNPVDKNSNSDEDNNDENSDSLQWEED